MNITKRRIFEISTELFAKKGYEATSIEEITAIVGVAKGTLYYHFSSKEEMFKQLITDGMDFLDKSIELKTRKVSDPIEKLRRIIIIQIKVTKKFDKFMIFLFGQIWGGEPRNMFVREKINGYIDTIEKIVIEAKEKGLITGDDTRMIADTIFSQFCVTLLHKLNLQQEINVDELGNKFIEIIKKGIC